MIKMGTKDIVSAVDHVIYLLVDDDTDGSLGNVENTSSGTVVALVWHTLLESTITLDIDDISLVE